jgi:CO dehydrogenase/acetyl-CoA synthase delta subunit
MQACAAGYVLTYVTTLSTVIRLTGAMFKPVILPMPSSSQSYVQTDGQSASLSWCQAPIWGPIRGIYYCHVVAGSPTFRMLLARLTLRY